MTGRAEPKRIGRVGKTPKNLFQTECQRALFRDGNGVFRAPNLLLSGPIQCNAKQPADRLRAVIGDMNIHTVRAFVRGPDSARSERVLQEPISGFGPAVRIENAPTGPGLQIRAPQHDSAAARRSGTAPLAKHLRHDLARDHAREFPIATGIGVASGNGIDGIKQLEVMIANVFKVPAGARVPRHTALPDRVRGRDSSRNRRRYLIHCFGFRDVSESEALAREPNFRSACVLKRPQVGSDAEIVCYTASRPERHISAAGSRRYVGNAWTAARGDAGQFFAKKWAAAHFGIQTKHAHLLFDLRIPADDGRARMP